MKCDEDVDNSKTPTPTENEKADGPGDDTVSTDVPTQYKGTTTDRHDMRTLGNIQVLRRTFKPLAMIGFANSVMVMWETFLVTSGLGLSVGGRAPVFWGLVYGACTMPFVYLTIAELASV